MQKTEQQIIKKSNVNFKAVDNQCFLSKNLYNYANYLIRQEFINNNKWLRYNELEKKLRLEKQIDYISLPNNSSQQILMLLDRNWKSFFQAIKVYKKENNKFLGKPKLPKYKDKNGRNIIVFTYNQCKIKDNYIHFPRKTNIQPIKTTVKKIQQVRIIPKGGYYVLETVYNVEIKMKDLNLNRDNFIAIDLGVNNLCAITSNKPDLRPVLINGRALKSINQFYSKEKAELQSKLQKNKHTSNRISSLTLKRNNLVKNFYHHVSKFIISYCVQNDIGNIIIGHNVGWKQEVDMGKRNNQNFILISHFRLIRMVYHKAEEIGIRVKEVKENYTSKVSSLHLETIERHDNYLGKRVKRGLFEVKDCLINADVNGSFNILRKEIGDDFISLLNRGFIFNPVKCVNALQTTLFKEDKIG